MICHLTLVRIDKDTEKPNGLLIFGINLLSCLPLDFRLWQSLSNLYALVFYNIKVQI